MWIFFNRLHIRQPGGIDVQGLVGTGTALLASLIGGDENFGKVLGNIVGLSIDGFSGGGGAVRFQAVFSLSFRLFSFQKKHNFFCLQANNGQFFGQFLGKFVSVLSAVNLKITFNQNENGNHFRHNWAEWVTCFFVIRRGDFCFELKMKSMVKVDL